VRHQPAGLDGASLDDHTRAWVARVNRSGEAFLTPAEHDGRWLARVALGGLTTTREDVQAAWTVMRREAEQGGTT
jgi:aromatic-L-amino-acid decarboxylase